MRVWRFVSGLGVFFVFVSASAVCAQDERAQYPRFLSNSYFGMNFGYINYSFSASQMTPGFNAEFIRVPHLAARVLLFGHEFNKYFSVQVTYLRPGQWVRYENVNSDHSSHSVWMNVAGLTARLRLPITGPMSLYGESGLGLITRKGFDVNGVHAVKDAEYASSVVGAGIAYRLNRNWDLSAGMTLSPEHRPDAQPRTSFVSAGFNYMMRPLTAEQVARNVDPAVQFPKSTIQVGYITDAFGYGVNNFVSKGAVPVFWSADVEAASGVSLNYQRNTFHTRRVFSLDWGTGITALKSRKTRESVLAVSLYPLLRFTLLRTRPADLYFDYSLAGPTFISRTIIDGSQTGRHFTFQDFMGVGVFMNHRRRINPEIRIMHYSNGNLFPRNPGVTVPLAFNLGYTF